MPTTATGRVGPLTPAVAAPIRGQIELLEGGIAQISVGSDDGVSKGMIFVIYRDGNYLGRMTIEEVEPNHAAGSLSHLQGDVRVGDKVADETRFQVMQ